MKKSLKIGILSAILTAGLFGASKLDKENINQVMNNIPSPVRNGIDHIANNAIYDRYDTAKKYVLVDYTIQENDKVNTLVHGKQYLVDLVRDVNGIKDFGKLHAGDIVIIPVESEEGKTFVELYRELYEPENYKQN